MSIATQLQIIRAKISDAAKKSGRKESDVKLVAVSKTFSPSLVREAYLAQQKVFGENYVQEFLPKCQALSDLELEWHFIGHLQTNKVKSIVGRCALIHSVDRISVIDELAKRSSDTQKILIEVNLAGEMSKTGARPTEIPSLIDKIQMLPHLQLCGLMTMPPLESDATKNKKYFAELKELGAKWAQRLSPPHSMAEYSMGTSHDYEFAVECGATYVRIGTSIFGKRE